MPLRSNVRFGRFAQLMNFEPTRQEVVEQLGFGSPGENFGQFGCLSNSRRRVQSPLCFCGRKLSTTPPGYRFWKICANYVTFCSSDAGTSTDNCIAK